MNIYFIRHAEPTRFGDDFNRGLSDEGVESAKKYRQDNIGKFSLYETLAFSYMKRAEETAKILFDNSLKKFGHEYRSSLLNEIDKRSESKEVFISRVDRALNDMVESSSNIVVISHARFMTVAHQLLKPKEIVLGFDFLEGFEYEY